MKYYCVIAKCGHVGGKTKYIDIPFYTAAETAAKAAQFVRMAPRVKHHHPDAIRSVQEIDLEEYLAGKQSYENDPFTNCTNIQQQRAVFDRIADRIQTEEQQPERSPRGRNPKRSYRYGYTCNKHQTLWGSFDWRAAALEA